MSKLGSNKQCDSVIKIRSKEGETCKGIVMSFWKEIQKGIKFKACLQGGKVTPVSGLTLAGGQKVAWIY